MFENCRVRNFPDFSGTSGFLPSFRIFQNFFEFPNKTPKIYEKIREEKKQNFFNFFFSKKFSSPRFLRKFSEDLFLTNFFFSFSFLEENRYKN